MLVLTSARWRSKQLEYTWLRSLMGCHADFWQVTRDAVDYALTRYQVSDASLQRDLLEAYLRLECYPEVPDVLRHLKRRGCRTAVLSNATSVMLTDAAERAGIAQWLDHLISAEAVGTFKPDPRVYRLAVETLRVEPGEISFQTSNAWGGVWVSVCLDQPSRATTRKAAIPGCRRIEVPRRASGSGRVIASPGAAGKRRV